MNGVAENSRNNDRSRTTVANTVNTMTPRTTALLLSLVSTTSAIACINTPEIDASGSEGSTGPDELVDRSVIDVYDLDGLEQIDQCCLKPSGQPVVDTVCFPDTDDACLPGYSRVGCHPCGYAECNYDGGPGEGWAFQNLVFGYQCHGTSWEISSGRLIDDDCMASSCHLEDEGTCTSQEAINPNCPVSVGATQSHRYDGEIGRMCCRAGAVDNGRICMPREEGLACNQDGYTTAAYCLPCPGIDPSDPNFGGWDLVADGASEESPAEWPSSRDCGGAHGDGIYDPPGDGEFDACRIMRFECGGVLVTTGGTLLSDRCAEWP